MAATYNRLTTSLAVGFAILVVAACSKAPPFEFTTATPEIEMGHDVVVEVRLRNTASDTVVNDAIISAIRLDMAPDGMSQITSEVTPQPSTELGAYRFSANFKMAGRWELSLTAQIPGEPQPTTGSVIIVAK